LVFNKLDALPPELRPTSLVDSMDVGGQQVPRLFVSARQGEGLAALRLALAERVKAALSIITDLAPSPNTFGHNPGWQENELKEPYE
jgi:GTP-binding protein HflX